MKESVTKFDLQDAFKALDEIEYPEVNGGLKARVDDYKPLHENLAKRAMRTDLLIEDYYDVNDQEDLENAQDDREAEVAKAKLARIEKIVDLDAESEDDLLTSYAGKVIIQCPQCMTLFYKNEEDLEKDEENPDVVNINEVCQHCGNDSGYMVIGKVAPVDEEELGNFEEEPAEEDNMDLDLEEPEAEEAPEEENEEDLNLDLNLEDEEEPAEESFNGAQGQVLVEETQNESLNNSEVQKDCEEKSELKTENESENLTLNEESSAEQKLKEFVDSLDECNAKPAKKFIAGLKEAVEIKVTVEEVPEESAEGGIIVDPICADGACEEPVVDEIPVEEIPVEIEAEEAQPAEEPIEDAEVEQPIEAEEIPAEEEEEEVEESLNNAKAAELENECENKSEEAVSLNEEAEVSDAEIAELLDSKEFNEPISDAEIEAAVDEDFSIDKLDDIDEDSLNECITNSLTDVYENVNNFTAKECSLVSGKLVVEGVINFKSGNTKASTYIFNERVKKQDNNYVLTGINEGLDENGSFSLIGKLTNNRKNFIAESLSYKYNIGGALIEGLANRK